MIVCLPSLFETPLEAAAEKSRRVRGDVRAEQIERNAVVEVQVALHGGQIDYAQAAQLGRIVGAMLCHDFGGALQNAADARFAYEHVVGFFREHEASGARERIESRLGQRRELEFAVAIGEISEHEKRQPIGRLLVEGAQDARIVDIARAALEQCLRLFTPVATEIALQ